MTEGQIRGKAGFRVNLTGNSNWLPVILVAGHLALCIQTSKQTSFEQLIDLDYFTLVRTCSLPRLLYSRLLLFSGKVTSLGGELVGGETESLMGR